MDAYQRIETVIRYLDQHHTAQPDLAQLAEISGLSLHHFHRLFHCWAGVTPMDFLKCLTHAHSRSLLEKGKTVLNASLSAGLSGPGRLHDLCIKVEAATPGEIRSGGMGLCIRYGYAQSPFGECLIAQSHRGICHLSFLHTSTHEQQLAALQQLWPHADYEHDDRLASELLQQLFVRPGTAHEFKAHIRGSRFQLQVWKALIQIPPGQLLSYGDVASLIGRPSAARAVGSAIGKNPIAYLIPCHRVIRDTGIIAGYHWGNTRKRSIIAWESAHNTDSL